MTAFLIYDVMQVTSIQNMVCEGGALTWSPIFWILFTVLIFISNNTPKTGLNKKLGQWKMYHCVLNTLSNILIMNVMWNTAWIQHRKRTYWCGTSCIHNTRKSNKTVSHVNFYSPWMVSSESLLTSYRRIASSSSICVEIVHGSPKNKDWDKELLKIKFT
jgi:hypothetical protein